MSATAGPYRMLVIDRILIFLISSEIRNDLGSRQAVDLIRRFLALSSLIVYKVEASVGAGYCMRC
jgi:hypothetical protein